MVTILRPSWGTGFTRSAGSAAAPDLWTGLALLYAPILGSQGGQLFDLSGYGLHASVGGATYTIGSQGVGLLCATGTQGVVFTAPEFLKVNWSSLIWYGRFTGTPSANTPMLGVSYSNADASPYIAYLLDVDGVGTGMRSSASRSGFFQGTAATPLSIGVDYVTVGTYMANSIKLYVNGIFQSENTNVGGPTYSATSQVLVGRHQSETSRVLNAQCYLAALYTRTLTACEVAQISADPLILLRQRPIRRYRAPTISIPQLARPNADTTVDNWTDFTGGTTTIYQTLDDTVGDATADADGIQTQLSPTSDVFVAKLSPVFDPLLSTGYVVRYRYGKSAALGQQVNLTVQLWQDYVSEGSPGTLIAEAVHTDIPAFPTVGTLNLTGGESDAITDHANLFIRLLAHAP